MATLFTILNINNLPTGYMVPRSINASGQVIPASFRRVARCGVELSENYGRPVAEMSEGRDKPVPSPALHRPISTLEGGHAAANHFDGISKQVSVAKVWSDVWVSCMPRSCESRRNDRIEGVEFGDARMAAGDPAQNVYLLGVGQAGLAA